MTQFRQKAGTTSAVHRLKKPVPDITAFDEIVRSLIQKNALGCISHWIALKHHPPIEIVREMYTAKFVYTDATGKRIGSGSEVYHSVEGYHTGIAAVISNMANLAAHGGKVRHIPDSDLFSITLKCQDPGGELYYLSIARNRVTISSYSDDAIRTRISQWNDSVPALE
jgi:hypothetical protein